MIRIRIILNVLAFLLIIQSIFPYDKHLRADFPDLESYKIDDFPLDVVALHMPCEESNMFATNCACHIKCVDQTCKEAWQICEKYKTSKGCKYVLFRGSVNNKIATLKRTPTRQELERVSIIDYPTSMDRLPNHNAGKRFNTTAFWQSPENKSLGKKGNKKLSDLVTEGGEEAQSALTSLFVEVNTKKLCGHRNSSIIPKNLISNNATTMALFKTKTQTDFLSEGIALVCVNYRTPMTLINTLRSWKSSGLLNLVSQRLMILNDPYASEIAMALEYEFEILEPRSVQDALMVKPNLFTIGAAFHYALQHVEHEYVLFLESDFKMDLDLKKNEIIFQLLGAAGMLNKGAEVIRLLSKKGQGCGTFKSCTHGGIHLASKNPFERVRNWYSYYCEDSTRSHSREKSAVTVATCMRSKEGKESVPAFRCFTSWDSNWSLNAAMFKKSTMLLKKYNTAVGTQSIGDIALLSHSKQDAFESSMIHEYNWMTWRVPICIAYSGMFLHEEIETSS